MNPAKAGTTNNNSQNALEPFSVVPGLVNQTGRSGIGRREPWVAEESAQSLKFAKQMPDSNDE